MTSTLWMLLPYASFAPKHKHARMHAVPAVVVNLLYTKSYHHQTTFALHKTRGCIHGTVHKQILRSTGQANLFLSSTQPHRRAVCLLFFSNANSNQEEGLVRWCKRSSRMTDWLCLSKSEWRSKDQVHGRRRRHPPSEQGSFQQRPGSSLLGVISFDFVTRSG